MVASSRRLTQSLLGAAAVLVLAIGLFTGCMGGDDNNTSSNAPTTTSAQAAATSTPLSSTDISNPESTTSPDSEGDAPAASATSDSSDNDVVPMSVADIVDKVNPAVVTVINEQQFQGFSNQGDDLQPVGSGTGFIISEDGYIVTNNHVVEGSDGLKVIFENGDEVDADLVGTDVLTDLAVIKISGDVPATVSFGDSTDLRPGDPVIAIGSALGAYTNTVTLGIVSGLGRELDGGQQGMTEGMIQHDAAINPGNSGGPLLNVNGEVVGVNTAVVRFAGSGVPAEGLGFAIPSHTVQQIAQTLIEDGKVTRPYLGIEYQLITPQVATTEQLPRENGALVTNVVPGGPADDAGLLQGDIILSIDGDEINADQPLVNLLFEHQPGDDIEVEVYRTDTEQTQTLTITLGTRPATP